LVKQLLKMAQEVQCPALSVEVVTLANGKRTVIFSAGKASVGLEENTIATAKAEVLLDWAVVEMLNSQLNPSPAV
jgi:hypothetical protein